MTRPINLHIPYCIFKYIMYLQIETPRAIYLYQGHFAWCSRKKGKAVQTTTTVKLQCHCMSLRHHLLGMLPQVVPPHLTTIAVFFQLLTQIMTNWMAGEGKNTQEPPTWTTGAQGTGHSTNFIPWVCWRWYDPNRRGTAPQLQQKMAMGMRKSDSGRILQLSNWTEIDEAMLTKLP
jgi:hypothetical protein